MSDYEFVKEKLLAPLDLSIPQSQWEEVCAHKVNRTRSRLQRFAYAKLRGKRFVADTLPEKRDWTPDQMQTYERLCGDLAQRLGYD